MLNRISIPDQKILLNLARESIKYGLEHQQNKLQISLEQYSKTLTENKACFVTIEKNNQLRGCIGTLVARNPLVQETIYSAFSAAFLDPRFPKVTTTEFPDLKIYISVLTNPEPIKFDSEQDLLSKLQPNIDGLILKKGSLSGTFLPSVWEQLPKPQEFLQNLKLKAGLPVDYWSNKIEIFRYQTEMFGE